MTATVLDSDTARRQLGQLYEREKATVFGFLLARCGARQVAEDLTAEVFINAARRFAEGRQDEVTTAWLITTARRRLIDHWRWREGERRRLDRVRRERRVPDATDPDDERVLRALDSLPDRQRIALTLRYLDEHSVTEIAETMDVSYRTVESLLGRARRGFSRAYEEST